MTPLCACLPALLLLGKKPKQPVLRHKDTADLKEPAVFFQI